MKDQVIKQTIQTLAIHLLVDEESGLTTIKQILFSNFYSTDVSNTNKTEPDKQTPNQTEFNEARG
jgi:hypothetical protein